jgi:hypothetical protein
MSIPVFVFEHLQPLPEPLPESLYLALLKTDKTPPHLGLIAGNNWYTLDVKGATTGADAARLLQSLRRKNIPSVFVQLAWPRGLRLEQMQQLLHETFSAYPALGDNEHTCVSPIREVLAHIYDPQLKTCDFVFDLLRILADKNLVQQTYHFAHDDTRWEMPGYGIADVRKGIVSAQLKKSV